MNILYLENLKEQLIKKLHYVYILLGEDIFLLNKAQDIILNYAYKKKFIKTTTLDVLKNQDWKKIDNAYKLKELFSKKNILIINLKNKKLDFSLIKKINEIYLSKNKSILTILKFNQLSANLIKNKSLKIFKLNKNIIYCFHLYKSFFKNWMQYEIKEKNLKITKNSFLLLYKYYEGNALFLNQILKIFTTIWPNKKITSKSAKKIINKFAIFSPIHWIDAIFDNDKKKALYILDIFYQQKYNPLILIRYLQKNLLKLMHMKREKNLNIQVFFKKNNIFPNQSIFFIKALKYINFNNFLKVIRILLQIEISIKKKYNYSVWIKLKTVTLLLFLQK